MRTQAFAPIILSIVLLAAACGGDTENSSLTVEAETTTSTTSTSTTTIDGPVDEDPVVEAETTTPQTTTNAPPEDDSEAEAETVDAEVLTADEDVEFAFDDPAGYFLVEHLAAELGGPAEVREGAIVRGTQDAFVVDYKTCCTDDNLYASITSLEDNAVFTIYAPDGQAVLVEATSANLLLEQGGEYWVVVGATRGNASYTAEIGLSQNEDVELAFNDPAGYYLVEHLAAELGGTAEIREGAIVRGTQDAFVVDYKTCCTDDSLYASISSLEDNAVFTIYAPDGQAVLVEATSANLLLEQGGEYWVVVGATRGNASYTVEIGLSQNAA